MNNLLGAIFKIRPGEGRRVVLFVLLFLLLQAGMAIGISTTDSLFLLTVGPENLPKVYIVVPVIMMIYIPVNGYLTTRLGVARVFNLALIGLVGGGVVLWVLLGGYGDTEWKTPILYGAKIYTAVAFVSVYSISWNFVYQFFNILDGKRLFSFLTAGSALGAILGGALITALTSLPALENIPVSSLFLVWSGLALAAVPVLARIRRTQKVIEVDLLEEETAGESIFRQTVKLGRIIRKSRFVLVLLSVLITAQILTTLNEFQYLRIFSEEKTTEKELTELFGHLFIAANVFNLVVSLFVFNRLVLRFGVRNLALLVPVMYTLLFSWLYLQYGFTAGLFGFFIYQGLMASIDYDNTNLLLNGLPSEANEQVRTFIEGLAEPIATAIAGIFLITLGSMLNSEMIALIGIGISLVYVSLVLVLRHNYAGAMITNLKKTWLDFSRNSTRLVRGLDESALDLVEKQARSRDPEMAPTAIGILWLNDQPKAADALLDFMSHVKPEFRRNAAPLFSRLLREDDPALFRRILDWLDRDQVLIDTDLVQEISISGLPRNKYLFRMMRSPGPQERATEALELLKSWRLKDRSRGLGIFKQLFSQQKPQAVAAAIQAIGRTGVERYAHLVAPYMVDSNREIRSAAIAAVERLVTPDSGRLVPEILRAIRVERDAERLAAMNALLAINDPQCIAPLLMEARVLTASERRRAESVVESVGLQGVPMAISVLRNRTCSFRGRAIAARSLANLSFAQFEDIYPELIHPELELAYRSLHRYQILSGFQEGNPGVTVLCRLFLDARLKIVEFILELLSIGGRIPDFELISASLRSTNEKERANAIETIEQGISREYFHMLLPLVDSRSIEERVSFYFENFDHHEITPVQIATDSLNSNFLVGSIVAVQALTELDAPGLTDLLRQRLNAVEAPEFRHMVLSTIGVEEKTLSLVDRIYSLLRTPLFGEFGVIALKTIATEAEEIHWIKGERVYGEGEPASDLYYLIGGKVHLDGRDQPVREGEIFGEECLFGKARREGATSEMARALRIDKNLVFENANIYPETILYLLEYHNRTPA